MWSRAGHRIEFGRGEGMAGKRCRNEGKLGLSPDGNGGGRRRGGNSSKGKINGRGGVCKRKISWCPDGEDGSELDGNRERGRLRNRDKGKGGKAPSAMETDGVVDSARK